MTRFRQIAYLFNYLYKSECASHVGYILRKKVSSTVYEFLRICFSFNKLVYKKKTFIYQLKRLNKTKILGLHRCRAVWFFRPRYQGLDGRSAVEYISRSE